MPLTELQIKALKPQQIRYAVSDGRGLALEVMPTGAASWRYRYQFKGKTEKVSLGKYPLVSLRAARSKRDELAKAVHEGVSPAKQKQLENFAANSTSVADFSERYFKEVIEKDRKDTKQLRRYLEKQIYPAFGSWALRDVTAQDVQRIVFKKRDNGFESAAAQIRNLLKRIFDYAIVCGVVTVNPTHATPMRFITRARPRTRSLSSDELKIYLQVLYRSNIRRQFKLILDIILLTVVRKSELLQARWINVNLDAGEWLIPEAQSKTGKQHTVYLSTQVREMFMELQQLAGDSELVLPGRGSLTRPFAANALNQAMGAMSFPMPLLRSTI